MKRPPRSENAEAFSLFSCFERFKNDAHHSFHIFHHLVVPKEQDFVAICLQKFAALIIVHFLFQMLAAIDFDNEFLARSTKINNVIANRVLAAEMNVIGLVRAQEPLEFSLGLGLVVA